MSAPNFSEFGTWMKSPEYRAEMAKLLGEKPQPPRQDWPVDTAALAQRHREIGTMAMGWAVDNFRRADEYEAAP